MAKKPRKQDEAAQDIIKARRGRVTTMPPANGPADPNRPAAGPPATGIAALLNSMFTAPLGNLYLISFVDSTQVAQDSVTWFPDAPTYIDRAAYIETTCPQIFKDFPYRGSDLLARKDRIQQLGILLDQAQLFVRNLANTLYVERADVIQMADNYCATCDLTMRIPTTAPGVQTQLNLVANAPLAVWRERMDGILAQRRGNDRMRGDLADAQQQASDLQSQLNGIDPPASVPVAPAPAKAGRRRTGTTAVAATPAPSATPSRPKNTRSTGR